MCVLPIVRVWYMCLPHSISERIISCHSVVQMKMEHHLNSCHLHTHTDREEAGEYIALVPLPHYVHTWSLSITCLPVSTCTSCNTSAHDRAFPIFHLSSPHMQVARNAEASHEGAIDLQYPTQHSDLAITPLKCSVEMCIPRGSSTATVQ